MHWRDIGRRAALNYLPFQHPWYGQGRSPANNFRKPLIRAWEAGFRIGLEERRAAEKAKAK